jgi:hypothetical protein
MGVHDGVDVRAQVIDGEMHAELACGVARAREEVTAKIDDDEIGGLEQALAHASRCGEQTIAIEANGEIAGRAGSKTEPGD